MKRTMCFLELPPIVDNQKHATVVQSIRKPGIVRNAFVQGKRPLVSPIIQGIDPKNIVELLPTIVFEIDPDEETEERTFILIPHGVILSSDNELKYQGTFMYPQGHVIFLFEEVMPPKE